MSSYKGPPTKIPSGPVEVSTANSPFLSGALWLSPAAITLILTPDIEGETDPSI